MNQDASVFLQAKHLSKIVQSGDSQLTILSDVDINIACGESVAILGASGS
jgi:predicted ABC-type transport system involved in lysophospholipase L1 biosynthesis ATPase subunit